MGKWIKKMASDFELKWEEMVGKIEEGKIQAVWIEEKLEGKIESTNIRIDKVNEDLDGDRACVDARMWQQIEEWGCVQKRVAVW